MKEPFDYSKVEIRASEIKKKICPSSLNEMNPVPQNCSPDKCIMWQPTADMVAIKHQTLYRDNSPPLDTLGFCRYMWNPAHPFQK